MFIRLPLIVLSLLFTFNLATAAIAVPVNPAHPSKAETRQMIEDFYNGTDAEAFVAMSRSDFEANLGRELNWKERIAVRKAQKMVAKQMKRKAKGKKLRAGDNQLVALLLAILIGGLGIHRFYLGYTWMGILYIALLLTSFLIVPGIALLVLVLIDIIRIATGSLQPKDGSYTKTL